MRGSLLHWSDDLPTDGKEKKEKGKTKVVGVDNVQFRLRVSHSRNHLPGPSFPVAAWTKGVGRDDTYRSCYAGVDRELGHRLAVVNLPPD